MAESTIYKTVCQYSKNPVSKEDMEKLQEIARDYSAVKNYVYQRYGGIKGLSKLYPGYTVQNEMTDSGLRAKLGMPSVYFYLAVFDALGDIKAQWTRTKERILQNIGQNQELGEDNAHYLRFVLKNSNCFASILLNQETGLPKAIQRQREELSARADVSRMDHYLRRQVRKYLLRPHTDAADGFSASERAYRYGDHGIYLTIKESRKRIFVPLTDNNRYNRQIYIKLYPEQGGLKFMVPVNVRVKQHKDYSRETGIAMGMRTMLTTDEGHFYGENFGEYQRQLEEHVLKGARQRNKVNCDFAGRKKYYAKKQRLEAALHTYVNQELNRFIQTEKPGVIYMPKLPQISRAGVNRDINRSVSMWQKGYVRKRLEYKAGEHSIEVVKVWGKGISSQCSRCGRDGRKEDGIFVCRGCGARLLERVNAAGNALKRGREEM